MRRDSAFDQSDDLLPPDSSALLGQQQSKRAGGLQFQQGLSRAGSCWAGEPECSAGLILVPMLAAVGCGSLGRATTGSHLLRTPPSSPQQPRVVDSATCLPRPQQASLRRALRPAVCGPAGQWLGPAASSSSLPAGCSSPMTAPAGPEARLLQLEHLLSCSGSAAGGIGAEDEQQEQKQHLAQQSASCMDSAADEYGGRVCARRWEQREHAVAAPAVDGGMVAARSLSPSSSSSSSSSSKPAAEPRASAAATQQQQQLRQAGKSTSIDLKAVLAGALERQQQAGTGLLGAAAYKERVSSCRIVSIKVSGWHEWTEKALAACGAAVEGSLRLMLQSTECPER
jgi:hypothetical protein